MDRSPEVMWALTKKWNSQLVKFQGRHWTRSPCSMTGKWNASEASRTVGVAGAKVTKDGKTKAVYTVSLKTKSKNGIKKRAGAGSQRVAGGAVCEITRGRNRAAKAVQSLTYQNSRDKAAALNKIRRLGKSLGSGSKGDSCGLVTKKQANKN